MKGHTLCVGFCGINTWCL